MPVRIKVETGASSAGRGNLSMEVDDIGNLNDDTGSEDGIVREIDVYLSPQLAQHLHMLQFPLQHASSTTSHTASSSSLPDSVRVKPRHNMMEMDQRIPSSIETEGNFQMEYRTFASHTIPITTNLALGKLLPKCNDDNHTSHDLALHLVPLTHITQMRPTFTHVDAHMDSGAGGDEDAALEQQKELEQNDTQEKKPLIYQKKESERAALARKSSYAYKKASEGGEEWLELRVVPEDEEEEEYAKLTQKVACPDLDVHVFLGSDAQLKASATTLVQPQASSTADQGPSKDYIRSLNYLPVTLSSSSSHANINSISNCNVIDISEDDEVDPESWKIGPHITEPVELSAVVAHLTTLLRHRGGPIPFSILRQSLPLSVSNKDIAQGLTICAVMVRGNFVLQSRLLPLPPAIIKARTFLLLLLQSIGCIHRSRLEQVLSDNMDGSGFSSEVAPETLFMLLKQVAHKTSHGWVLKVNEDGTIAAKFPQETAMHMQYWGRQMLRFQSQLKRYSLQRCA